MCDVLCLMDYGVERNDFPDGMDISLLKKEERLREENKQLDDMEDYLCRYFKPDYRSIMKDTQENIESRRWKLCL